MDLSTKLNDGNVESRNFLSFFLPSNAQLEDKGEFSDWCERMIFLVEDLKWLLALPVDGFWNQILFDSSWLNCLDTFLQNAPRYYDLRNIPSNCRTALSRVSRLYLLVLKRMSMHQESQDLRFTLKVFGDIIYNAYLFDAPKLLDMCAIFYRPDERISNLLMEILESIFTSQPKYFDDVGEAMESMVMTLNTMEEKLTSAKGKKSLNGRDAIDQLLFLFDLSSSLGTFIEMFPRSSSVFFKTNILVRLGSMCEYMLPRLLNLIEINQRKFKFVKSNVVDNVLKILHLTIKHAFIEPIQQGNVDGDHLAVEYMSMIDGLSQHQNFFAQYCSLGSISKDLEAMKSLKSVDRSNLEYLYNMAGVVVEEKNSDETLKQLRELLPNKTEAYINNCIKKYGPNVDLILHNVIEGIYQDESELPKQQTKKKKPIPNKDFLDDNKEHVALIRASLAYGVGDGNDYDDDGYFNKYGNVYDDEYDDTYDSHDVAAVDADSADDLKDLNKRRKFVTPIVLRRKESLSSSSGEDDEQTKLPTAEPTSGDATAKKQQETMDVIKDHQKKKEIIDDNERYKKQNNFYQNLREQRQNKGGGRGQADVKVGANRDKKKANLQKTASRVEGGVENAPHAQNTNNKEGQAPAKSETSNRGRGRGRGGRGRGGGNKHNRKNLADKKMAKGMY